MKRSWMFFGCFFLPYCTGVTSQTVGIKTNIPYSGLITPNLGIEVALDKKGTFETSSGFNPLTIRWTSIHCVGQSGDGEGVGLSGRIEDVIINPDGTPYLKDGKQIEIVCHYWEEIMRYRKGSIEGIINHADFQNISTGTDIMDFYFPVRNTPAVPVDYNIYRNHEYKFSVHALEQWTSAASGADSGTRNSVTELQGSSMVLSMNNR